MKKVISLVILVAMTSSLFVGCQEPYDPNKLYTDLPSKEVCKEIYLTFQDMGTWACGLYFESIYGDKNINYQWYYGTINGYIIILSEPGDVCVACQMKVADCTFEYGYPFEIYAYKDGQVWVLQEAYEKGLLTKDHIKLLEERHVEIVEGLWRQDN